MLSSPARRTREKMLQEEDGRLLQFKVVRIEIAADDFHTSQGRPSYDGPISEFTRSLHSSAVVDEVRLTSLIRRRG